MIRTYFTFCHTADEHQTVRALARFGLAHSFGLSDVVFGKDACGKPFVEGGGAHISLSHSHRLCMAVIADEPVGCDVEKHPDAWDSADVRRVCRLAERFFSADEAAAVQNKPACFYDLWTAKESYIKYTGEGFSRPLSSFSVLQMENVLFTAISPDGFSACICSQNRPQSDPHFVGEDEIARCFFEKRRASCNCLKNDV